MSNKPTPTEESLRRHPNEDAREENTEEVVLPDESDAIIAQLKNQLQSLQQQLNHYQSDGEGPPAETPFAREPRPAELDRGMTKRIASRLEIPAEELTARLERLIGQIQDPELKAELIHCRETAFFLFDTFRHISEKHDELTDSLTAESMDLEREDFLSRLEASLRDRNLPVTLEADASLPGKIRLPPTSVITVLATLAGLAVDIFGRPGTVRVYFRRLEPGGDPGEGTLELRLDCESPLLDLGRNMAVGQAVSAAVIRSGVHSHSVVDLLYVEKIIEMRGGQLEFIRVGDQVNGFTVTLPIFVPGGEQGAA